MSRWGKIHVPTKGEKKLNQRSTTFSHIFTNPFDLPRADTQCDIHDHLAALNSASVASTILRGSSQTVLSRPRCLTHAANLADSDSELSVRRMELKDSRKLHEAPELRRLKGI